MRLSRSAKRGGGIAIYFKSDLPVYVIEEFSVINDHIECLVIHAGTFVLAAVYRPPSGNKTDCLRFLDDMLCFMNTLSVPFFVMGDLNIDMLADEATTQQYIDVLASSTCAKTITLPTRVTINTSTLLDVCITNLPNKDTVSGAFPLDLSDHFPIFCISQHKLKKEEHPKGPYYYRKINEESLKYFSALLSHTDWNDVFLEDSVNLAYQRFEEKIKECYDQAFPFRELKKM